MARTIAERDDVVPMLAEVFRLHGFEGASLARICEGTGLGKGSIYHFFPGGKEEMADAVLAEIGAWFRDQVYAPLAKPRTCRPAWTICSAWWGAISSRVKRSAWSACSRWVGSATVSASPSSSILSTGWRRWRQRWNAMARTPRRPPRWRRTWSAASRAHW